MLNVFRVLRFQTVLIAGIALLVAGGRVFPQAGKDEVYVLSTEEHTLEQVEAAYKEMPPVNYVPPVGRWRNLPRTAAILRKNVGELKVVMLGACLRINLRTGPVFAGWQVFRDSHGMLCYRRDTIGHSRQIRLGFCPKTLFRRALRLVIAHYSRLSTHVFQEVVRGALPTPLFTRLLYTSAKDVTEAR